MDRQRIRFRNTGTGKPEDYRSVAIASDCLEETLSKRPLVTCDFNNTILERLVGGKIKGGKEEAKPV
jgi:hypothetical protein